MAEDKNYPLVIEGSGKKKKKPKQQRPPVEAPNTLQSAATGRILDLLAYGPIEGVIGGAKGVFLDGTPIQNENGTFNFEGVTVEFRNGDPDQDMIKGFTDVSNVREVNTEIRLDAPVVRSISNMDATSAIVTIRVNALYSRNSSTGDTNGASVPVAIEVERGGSWTRAVTDTISGKTTSAYERSYRISLPEGGTGATNIRVSRLNKESDTQDKGDSIAWSKLTEVVDVKQNYPGCALVGIEVDARQFANTLPSRQYLTKLSIIQVPTNYDPISRTYTGIWNGQFKWAWSDNPAWCFYDIASHPVIGANIKNINKFYLYELGKYCDELVDDGYGGKEPRFTFNTILSSPEDAITVFNTLTSVFRGMAYWGSDSVEVVADMPGPIRRQITPSDVIEGEFTYQGTALKERHSVAVVMWNDPENNYDQVPEIVELPEAVELLGYKEVEVTAVACTSRGQARRLGLWILYSEFYETQTVNFTTTVKNADFRPGDYFELLDPYRAGARLGGKVLKLDGVKVTLDAVPSEVSKGWTITLEKEDKGLERYAINSVNGNVLTLAKSPVGILSNSNFALSNPDLGARQFRVVSVVETDNHNYSITASEHNPGKYDFVEKGLKLPEKPTSLLPKGGLPQPTGLSAEVFTRVQGGTLHMNATVSWTVEEDPRLDLFVLDVKGPTDFSYRTVYTGSGLSVDLQDIEPGQWSFRVKATSTEWGNSPWFQKTLTLADLLQPLPPQRLEISTTSFTATIIPVQQRYSISDYEFWRSDVALKHGEIESNALYLGQSLTFVDTGLKFDTEYFYYVRAVNAYGKSDWVAGQGRTQADVEDILEAIFDEANEGPMGQWLQGEVEKIPEIELNLGEVVTNLGELSADFSTMETTVESITESLNGLEKTVEDHTEILGTKIPEIEGEISDISTSLNNLSQTVEGLLDAPEYDSEAEYLKGSIVKYEGALWAALQDTPKGESPDEGDYWTKVGDFESLTGAIEALSIRAQAVEQSIKDIGGELTATNSVVNAVRTAFLLQEDEGAALEAVKQWYSMAEASDELTAQSDAHTSVVRRLSVLKAEVGSNYAKLVELSEVMTTEFEAVAKKVDSLEVQLGDKASSEAVNELSTKVEEVEGKVTSQAQDITKLESGLETTNNLAQKGVDDAAAAHELASKKADASAVNSLTTKVEEVEGKVSSQSQDITKLESSLETTNNLAQKGVDDAATAHELAETKADASAVNSLTTKVEEIEGNVSSQAQDITKLESGLETTTSLAQKGVDDAAAAHELASKKADASAVNSLTTKVEEVEGKVTSQAQDITKLESSLETTNNLAQKGVDDAATAHELASKKADASAVNSLTTKVEEVEGKVTSQAQDITKLDSGLELTNSLAQKGVDDAAAAHELASKKADASAVNSLTTKVEEVEGKVSSLSVDLTKLTNTVETNEEWSENFAIAVSESLSSLESGVSENASGLESVGRDVTKLTNSLTTLVEEVETKASSEAVDALTSRVAETEEGIVANAQNITELSSEVESKASSEAVDQLTTKVEEIGEDVISNASNITKLNSELVKTNEEVSTKAEVEAVDQLKTQVTDIDGEVSSLGVLTSAIRAAYLKEDEGKALEMVAQWRADAEAGQETTARADEHSALARRVSKLNVSFGQSSASLQTLEEAFASEKESVAKQFTQLESKVGDNTSLIQAEAQARTEADSALANQITEMSVTLNRDVDEIFRRTSIRNMPNDNHPPQWYSSYYPMQLVQELKNTSVIGAEELGEQVNLETRVVSESVIVQTAYALEAGQSLRRAAVSPTQWSEWGSVAKEVNAAIRSEATVRAENDLALGRRIDTVVSSVGNNTSLIQSEVEARVTADEALGRRVDNLQVKVDEDIGVAIQNIEEVLATETEALGNRINTVQATADDNTAAIQSESQARATADTALGKRIDTVQAAASGNTAAIQTESQARADADTALGKRVDTVQTSIGDVSASVQQVSEAQATLKGDLNAMWGVKLQVNDRGEYVTAGVGLGIDNTSGIPQSNFIVQANNFIVQDGLNGAGQAAFSVSGGKVIIRSALIGDATITMAKIGGDLYSTNYVAGRSGWRLQQNGNFEINSTVAGQGRVEINNKGVRVYDANGRLRVKLGDLR